MPAGMIPDREWRSAQSTWFEVVSLHKTRQFLFESTRRLPLPFHSGLLAGRATFYDANDALALKWDS